MSEKIEKIVELDIDFDELGEDIFDETGVQIVSLVDEPAIQVDFLAFNKEKFVDPLPSESEDDFIGRCMGELKNEYPDEEQRLAVCYSYFEGKLCKGECFVDHEDYVLSDDAQKAILEFCKDDNNGEYLTTEDIIIDLTVNQFAGVGDVITAIKGLDILKRLSIKRDEPAEVYWRYSGPSAQRDFCKAMLNLSNRGKIFSESELDQMGSINAQFSPRGSSTYNKHSWKGGINCVHYFQKLKVFRNENGNKVIIIDGNPSNNKEENAMKSNNSRRPSPLGSTANNARLNFSIDDEKRTVIGPLMIPNKFILRRDEEGNPYYIFFSKETIKKMAEKFLRTNKHNNTDTNHDEHVMNNNTLLESWISESMKYDKSYKYGFTLPEGTWFVSYKINDDETWKRIKNKELRGFSLAGEFIQKLKPIKDERTLNEIKNILKKVK